MGFIAKLPCVACLAETGLAKWGVHVAHIRAGYPEDGWPPTGMAQKPSDRRTAPLCPPHHLDDQHKMNEREWWENLGIYPPQLCAALEAAYPDRAAAFAAMRKIVNERTLP